MDIRKLISSMFDAYAGLHPRMLQLPYRLEWLMTTQTLIELAKEHRIPAGALVLGDHVRFEDQFLGIRMTITEQLSDGEVSLVIKVV